MLGIWTKNRKELEIHSLTLLLLLPFTMVFLKNFLISKIILLPKTSMEKNLWMHSGVQCTSHIQKLVRLHFDYSCRFQPAIYASLVSPPFNKSRIKSGTDCMWIPTWDVHCPWHNLLFINWLKRDNVRILTEVWWNMQRLIELFPTKSQFAVRRVSTCFL